MTTAVPVATALDVPAYVTARPAQPAPAAPARTPAPTLTPTPADTCPPDGGITLTIDRAQVTSQSMVMAELAAVLTLENRQLVPVELSTIDLIHVSARHADGSITSAGSLVLPFKYTYNVPPGTWSFPLDPGDYLSPYTGYGSPTVSLQLEGEVWATNSSADMAQNSRYCRYGNVQMGPPLNGSWPG